MRINAPQLLLAHQVSILTLFQEEPIESLTNGFPETRVAAMIVPGSEECEQRHCGDSDVRIFLDRFPFASVVVRTSIHETVAVPLSSRILMSRQPNESQGDGFLRLGIASEAAKQFAAA